MTNDYDPQHTAILLVDPYNDFLAEGGKAWPMLETVARDIDLLGNLRTVIGSAREAGVRVVFVPHRRWRPGDYETWDHPNASQRMVNEGQIFADGTWGGEFHHDLQPQPGDVLVQEHWAQSGFANTDLNMQLQQHHVSHVVVVGLLANTCIESTARYAMELGYHVTLVTDATAAQSSELMHAAHRLVGPTYAHSILTTAELATALKISSD